MVNNVRKTKNNGGMMRNVIQIGKTVGKTTVGLSKDVGKDYLQTKSKKVLKDIYENREVSLNPEFIISGRKPPTSRKIHLLSNKNNKTTHFNLGGKTSKRKYRRNKTNRRGKKYTSTKHKTNKK